MQAELNYIVSVIVQINDDKQPITKTSFESYDECWTKIRSHINRNKKEGDNIITHHVRSDRYTTYRNVYEY